jgi:NNP family nitrate/nitrite transporter-like MFS transporter
VAPLFAVRLLFGVEITMDNAAALYSYFREEFELTTEKAAVIASIFGWMNLFARGLDGYFSDKANDRFGK